MSDTKFCPSCKTTKDVAEFYAEKRKPDGLQRVCKTCGKEKMNEWRKKNRDRYNESHRVWAENKRAEVGIDTLISKRYR